MNQAAKVGSVEPFEIASLWLVLGLLNRLQRRLQVRPRSQRRIAIGVQRLQIIAEIEWTCHVELVDRRAVVEQLQELNLGGAQIYDRGFNLRLVLHAQQFDAVQIDLADGAGLEALRG